MCGNIRLGGGNLIVGSVGEILSLTNDSAAILNVCVPANEHATIDIYQL